MKDAGPGEKVICQLRDPSQVVRSFWLRRRSERRQRSVIRNAERAECPTICRHCVVCKEAGDDLPQPFPLFGDWLMPSAVASPP